MIRKSIIFSSFIIVGVATAALSMGRGDLFASYSNSAGRGVCYGYEKMLHNHQLEMIANKAAPAEIRAETIKQLNRSDLIVPGSVQHRDYYPDIGEDHIGVQYQGEDHRTLLVFGYLKPEKPSPEEILECDRRSARHVFESLKASFERGRFIVIWSGGTKSFSADIVDEVLDELGRIRSQQTALDRAQWNKEKRFFGYEVAEQIRVPLDQAICQQH